MTFTKHLCASVVISTFAVSGAYAQDTSSNTVEAVSEAATEAVDAIVQGWSGTASLGATSISGNSESSNVSGALRLGKTVGRWEHLLFGSYFKGDSTTFVPKRNPDGSEVIDEDTGFTVLEKIEGSNSNRLALGYQPRYYWRPRTYFFGIIDYENDKPANIKLATRQVIGIGHKFYSNASGFLSVEGGFGNKTTDLYNGSDINGGIAYFGANYLNRINENLTFNADFRADMGGDNTYTEIGLGLAFKISERMAVKLSHFTRGNTDIKNPVPGSGSSGSDNVTTMNLVVDI